MSEVKVDFIPETKLIPVEGEPTKWISDEGDALNKYEVVEEKVVVDPTAVQHVEVREEVGSPTI